MGCAFEAAREQPKPRIKSAKRNQCDTTTTAIDTTTTTQRLTENLEIKDNYQQNHKTQTTTVKANTKQLKAAAQVLLTVQQQPQPQPKSQQLEQLQTLRQVALENKDALATHETIGARIDIKANSSDLQNSCHVNCHKRSEINRDEQQQQRRRCRRRHWRQDHTNRAAHSQERRSHSIVAATMVELPQCQQQLHEMLLHARAALMTSKQSSQQEAAAAASAAAEQSQQAENKLEQQQPLAYQHWRLKNVASAVVPATMSAAILANLSATSAAAYQYLGQHYKHYTQSFSFYAASSVILMLCYLTTTSTAAATQSETGALDKHPIHGIDWSKFDESSSDKEILDLLLEKKRYDKRLLPPVNGTLTVNVNVLLLSLASPDESSLKYEVEFLLNQQWNDPRLQYGNKSHYDFLNALHHHDSIWTPDTYFIMHGDFKDPIIPMHFALRIFRNGTITYAMRRHLILSCQGSLHIFPFDDPKCSFSMESISYEEAQIKYVWKNDEDTLRKSPSLTTLNAYLIKNQTTACDQNSWRGNYSCLRVDLIFTRDRAFYFTTVFIPGIILVTSSFITFWLEWNAVPARSMIGVTTMLNFFTTSNGFRSTLPVVSNLTAMNVWDGVCMCFIYASLLEFVCVNYVGRKRPLHNVVYRPGENPVTQRLPAVLSRIGVILASPLPGEKRRDAGAPNEIVACTTCGGSNSPCTHSANNGCATETCFVQVRKKEPPHPIRVAKTIDVIARITFPTAYAIFLIFFFVHYKGFS
ncbi:glutamate-gated chloride channel isoform X20 [Drosophila busckii]|uniref:glutamate-gated chloride channel isoform X20 n=1 Tax=Drosophila busckii TaxID=30019 RepID=UPI00083ED0F6|nr:glutamate-gated chloride channel isoform X20 [Drosophila busckii]